jgi:hypothetical protein
MIAVGKDTMKLPTRICWECGRKLHGNHYRIIRIHGLRHV